MSLFINLKNKKVVVIGLGKSGFSAALLANKNGANVYVTETGYNEDIKDKSEKLKLKGITVETKGHSLSILDKCDLVITSPGVSNFNPILKQAINQKIIVLSEIEFASRFVTKPIIAVTGTNGKTTTVCLIDFVLKNSGVRSISAGNIGYALSQVVLEQEFYDVLVLEVSSFQLEYILKFRPLISILLNITQDHLNRYNNNMQEYMEAKFNIFKNQKKDDLFISNNRDCLVKNIINKVKCNKMDFSCIRKIGAGAYFDEHGDIYYVNKKGIHEIIVNAGDLYLKGAHNMENVMACVCALKYLDIQTHKIKKALKLFKPPQHRMETVRMINGVEFINDSKATNIEALKKALLSYDKKIVLIAGGKDKNSDYTLIADLINKKVKILVLMGQASDKIAKAWGQHIEIKRCKDMKEAISTAYSFADENDIVLLSPACASFDMYENYEHRGNVFKQEVALL